MAKTSLNIRLEAEEVSAIAKAAKADNRSWSALARLILVEWLVKEGHLNAASSSVAAE